MDAIFGFVQARTKMLCELYLKEKENNHGNGGVLAITRVDNDIKLAYIDYTTLHNLNPEIYQELETRIANNTTDIIYFYVSYESESKLIELDIRDFIGGN